MVLTPLALRLAFTFSRTKHTQEDSCNTSFIQKRLLVLYLNNQVKSDSWNPEAEINNDQGQTNDKMIIVCVKSLIERLLISVVAHSIITEEQFRVYDDQSLFLFIYWWEKVTYFQQDRMILPSGKQTNLILITSGSILIKIITT